MTIRYKIGEITGSREQPSVEINVWDDAFGTLSYDVALATAHAAAPATILGANLKTADTGITGLSKSAVKLDLRYRRPGRNTLLLDTDAQTAAKKLFNFIEPVGVYDAGGDATSLNTSAKWKPDRQKSSSEFNSAKPITVDPLPNSRRLRYTTSASFVNDTYLDMVEDLVTRGVFNSAIYLGRAVGTLQLVQFSVTENDVDNWTLTFGFGYRAIKTNISVGDGVVIPTLRGCDYYWLREKNSYKDGKLQPKTDAAIVGQAWDLAPLAPLNLPYPGRLTTRTDDVSGVVTTLDGHGITNSDDAIIMWDGGQQIGDVSSVGGVSPASTVSFGSGTGDALPPLNTRVLIAKYIP